MVALGFAVAWTAEGPSPHLMSSRTCDGGALAAAYAYVFES